MLIYKTIITFQNKIFAVIKDKAEPLRFFTVTVDTITGDVDLMKRLRSVKDFQQLAVAPWMGVGQYFLSYVMNHNL